MQRKYYCNLWSRDYLKIISLTLLFALLCACTGDSLVRLPFTREHNCD
jgi:hypothetical protein